MKRLLALSVVVLVALAAAACGNSGSGSSSTGSGPVTVTMWHGQSGPAQQAMNQLVAAFNKTHPGIVVQASSGGTTTDNMLQKVTAGIAAGSYPDIAYIYGSWNANIIRSSKVVDLTAATQDPSWGWSKFWPSARQTSTVNGKVVGVPAIIDNLAVFYNKGLFAKAGLAAPSPNWTWDDFRADAKALTALGNGTFGTGYPADASEDTTWRFWPMLWQGGGQILDANGKAAFNSPAGVQALTLLGDMATQDKSLYADTQNTKITQLFVGNKLGMLVSGPWSLIDLQDAKFTNYGVQQLPAFNGDHQTISGPDNWVVFKNSDARSAAAITFLKWLTQPQQDLAWDMKSGSLPLRSDTALQPGFAAYVKKWGVGPFVANLKNSKNTRPAVTAYPQLSKAIGDAIVAVLLGQAQPQQALDQAVQQSNQALGK